MHALLLILVSTYSNGLEALGDATRRGIVELLREGPRSVGDLQRALPVSQPAVSQHLKVLREAGLVEQRPEGNRRIYRLRPEGWADLRAYVESFWDEVLTAFQDSARQRPETREESRGGNDES